MLPPIAPTVLERNPKFKVLYDDISQNKLNPDASTKDEKKQRLIDQAREVCKFSLCIRTPVKFSTVCIHELIGHDSSE